MVGTKTDVHCQAVLFAQLVDDPTYNDEEFPTQNDKQIEQKDYFLLWKILVFGNISILRNS